MARDLVNWRDLGSVMRWCREEAPLVRMIIAWDKSEGCYRMCVQAEQPEFVKRGYNIVAFIGGTDNDGQQDQGTSC